MPVYPAVDRGLNIDLSLQLHSYVFHESSDYSSESETLLFDNAVSIKVYVLAPICISLAMSALQEMVLL